MERTGDDVVLTVEVPPEAIREKEKTLLMTIARQVQIPGFRPGKAPRSIVLSRYGEEAFLEQLREELIQDWLNQALAEAGLVPITRPKVETVAFERGARFVFQAKFEVLPNVTIPDAPDIIVPEPPPVEVTAEKVALAMEKLRREAAILEPVERPAQIGDVVHLGCGQSTWEVIVGEDDLGRKLLGTKSGAVITLRDEEGHVEEFVVAKVYQMLLPDQEETAHYYGYTSWDALQEEVQKRLQREAEVERLTQLRLNALDALADAVKIEPPAGLLAEVVEEERRRLGVKSELRAEIEGAVRRRLRRQIVARLIAEQKGLLPTEEEVKRASTSQGDEPDFVRRKLILERASDWIIARARRSE